MKAELFVFSNFASNFDILYLSHYLLAITKHRSYINEGMKTHIESAHQKSTRRKSNITEREPHWELEDLGLALALSMTSFVTLGKILLSSPYNYFQF